MANFSYVIDSTFQPFSMQEMLVPMTAYKEAFEKSEEQYISLKDKADTFKYLSTELPEGSKARQLYEGYVNDLSKQADDLAHNGLSMSNRRALTSLRSRYQGEIGQLVKADTALKEEKALRRKLSAQDPSMLYALQNLSIDDFLDGATPNLYNISGESLYAKGAATGKAASSRIYRVGDTGATLGGYYRDWVQKVGYSPESLKAFRENIASIPELGEAVDSIMQTSGAESNLSVADKKRARQQIINGIIDGAVYQENHAPQRDLGVPTWAEKQSALQADRQFNLSKSQLEKQYMQFGYRLDKDGNPVRDPQLMKDLKDLKAAGKGKSSTGTSTSTSTGSGYTTQISRKILKWKGDNPKDINGKADTDYETEDVPNEETSHPGEPKDYDELPAYVQKAIDKQIGDSDYRLYQFYYTPYKSGGLWNDTETVLEIVPKKIAKYGGDDTIEDTEDYGAH